MPQKNPYLYENFKKNVMIRKKNAFISGMIITWAYLVMAI